MLKKVSLFYLAALLLAVTALNSEGHDAAALEVVNTSRVSVRSDGGQANGLSQFPDIVGNGRLIVFASDANNLVANDTNNVSDIFLHDRVTGVTERVSLTHEDKQANGSSYSPTVSDDGRFVAFHSFATDMVPGDTNNVADIFVRDRLKGETVVASFVLNGFANDVSFEPDISADGEFVTFFSFASNLVGGDTNGKADVFRFDISGKVMERVSVDSNEFEGNDDSEWPSISDDGNLIAFESEATNLDLGDGNTYRDIFVRDMSAGTTRRISLTSGQNQGNGDSTQAAISGDGKFVAFVSLANDLVTGDTNDHQDVFVRNLTLNRTERVSLATNGTQPNRSSNQPSISDDGRYVAFHSFADNLIGGDPVFASDIFIYDRNLDSLSRASLNSDGEVANESSKNGVLSSDGQIVVFSSIATNLVPGDTNGVRDIFVNEQTLKPEVSIDLPFGSPGSHFLLDGQDFKPSQSVQVWINGVFLGDILSDANGDISTNFITAVDTDEGTYLVGFVQDDLLAFASFVVGSDAPLRPTANPGFLVPDGIAWNNHLYLPFAPQ